MMQDELCYFGSINFVSYPGGGEVFIDGVDQGVMTPAIVTAVPIGTHTFTIKLEGYMAFSGTVEVLQDQAVIAQPAILVPAAGCIFFDSKPEGATIALDGEDTGSVTPKRICNLPLGIHVYRLVFREQVSAGQVVLKHEQGAGVTGIFKLRG